MQNVELGKQFTAYERLLWHVLAALVRNGYFVRPDDARDLIHDFYVEGWPGVVERFDEKQSQFSTYLSAAFYRFARRRILKLQDWRCRTVDVEELADFPSPGRTPAEIFELEEQIVMIRKALQRLPKDEREVLYDFVTSSDPSERALADRHSITRYRLREALANGIGRLANDLSQIAYPGTTEAKVAKLIWGEGRSPRNVAVLLGMSVPEVQAARFKFATELLASIRKFNNLKASGREIMNPILGVLRDALFSAGDHRAINHVHQIAPAIREALAVEDIHLTSEEVRRLEQHKDWVGQVYAALSDNDGAMWDDSVVTRALDEMRADESREIGEAFVMLMTQLDEKYSQWDRWFEQVPRPDRDTQLYLSEDVSVEAGEPYSTELLKFGLTPSMVYEAMRGLQLLFDRTGRLLERAIESWLSGEPLANDALRVDYGNGSHATIPYNLVLAQVAGTPDLPGQAVCPLMRWIDEILPMRPYLIEGYVYDPDRQAFMRESWQAPWGGEGARAELISRWCRRPSTQLDNS